MRAASPAIRLPRRAAPPPHPPARAAAGSAAPAVVLALCLAGCMADSAYRGSGVLLVSGSPSPLLASQSIAFTFCEAKNEQDTLFEPITILTVGEQCV